MVGLPSLYKQHQIRMPLSLIICIDAWHGTCNALIERQPTISTSSRKKTPLARRRPSQRRGAPLWWRTPPSGRGPHLKDGILTKIHKALQLPFVSFFINNIVQESSLWFLKSSSAYQIQLNMQIQETWITGKRKTCHSLLIHNKFPSSNAATASSCFWYWSRYYRNNSGERVLPEAFEPRKL